MRKLLFLLFLTFSVDAGVNTWSQRGPWGPYVYSLAVSPQNASIVYAGTYTGVYRSVDAGQNWLQIHPDAADVVLDPNDARVVYLTRTDALLRSTDSGATWTKVADDLVLPFHVDDESRLWGRFVSGDVGMSTDRGATWTTVAPVRASKFVSSKGVVFAEAEEEGRVYRTTDEGGSWQALPVLTANAWRVAVSPDSPAVIWAAAGGRVLHTEDGGSVWLEIAPPATTLHQFTADDERLVAVAEQSVFVSDNGGNTWREAAHDAAGGFRLAAYVATGDLLVAGAYGVRPSHAGMVAGEISFLRFGHRLYAGSLNSGLHASDDRGVSWQRLPARATALTLDGANIWMATEQGLMRGSQLVLEGYVTAIAANGNTVIASKDVTALHASHDGGQTWAVTGHNARYGSINDIVLDGNVAYAATRPVQVSLDGGRTWSATNADAAFSTSIIIPGAPSQVLLGGTTVLRAPSGSATFTTSGAGLPANSFIEDFAWNGSAVFAAVSPRDGGDSRIYVSRDRGETWTPYAGQPHAGRVTELEADGKTLWIGTSRGVYELTEGEGIRRRSARK